MKSEIFTICDSAAEYNGKVVIVGTFNEVKSPSYPVNISNFTLVARLAYEKTENPIREISINAFLENDPDLKIFNFKFPPNTKMTVIPDKRNFLNVMLKLDGISIPKPGTYKIVIFDGETATDIEFYAGVQENSL